MSVPARRSAVFLLGMSCCLAALLVHGGALARPALVGDDFQIVGQSWTWSDAWQNLWLPANEHAMPLGRLTTWLQVQLAGRAANLPLTLVAQGPLSVVLGLPLVYLFVRRELGHPFYGLIAMALFGVSSVYQQAVFWFSASFSVLSLDMTLLALLAAQHWRRRESPLGLLASAFWSALAPAWFAIGILAGPLCSLYLLPQEKRGWAGRLSVLAPLLGSAAFLAVTLPRTAERIMHLEHYQGRTALEAFHPLTGLLYTGRSLVDNLLLGVLGISTPPGVVCPLPLVAVVLVLVSLFGAWWWYGAPRRRLLLLGLGCIFGSYLLVYSARAEWPYFEGQPWMHTWSRYHLFPQLGLALFLCGGLPRWESRLFRLDPEGNLSRRQVLFLGLLIALLVLIQLPRGLIGAWYWYEPKQMPVLRQIDDMDARCRREHIDRDTARQALPQLPVPGSWDTHRDNGWDLLRGSPDPRPLTVAKAKQLLEGPDQDRAEPRP